MSPIPVSCYEVQDVTDHYQGKKGRDDRDGYYCPICGRIPPERITTKRILIDGRETGTDHLDGILDEAKKIRLIDDTAITEELLKRIKEYNYLPMEKTDRYAAALLAEYKKRQV